MKPSRALLVLAFSLVGLAAQAADQRIYSYLPADAATRKRIDSGLTFVFDKGFVGMRIKEVLATEAHAEAGLDAVTEHEMGGRLDALLPPGADERELYAVRPERQGTAMVRALCPGSTKGWLVFSPLRPRQDMLVRALGDDPATGKPRYCTTLVLAFHGEWRLPPPQPLSHPGMDMLLTPKQ